MKSRYALLVLVAGLAGCKSGGAEPPPVAKAEPQAMPALPIIPHKVAPAEAPVAAKPDSREARLAAITKEQDDAQNEYYAAIQKAMGDNKNPSLEEWQKIQAQVKRPDMKGYTERVQKLLDEDATDIAAFHALTWMLDNARETEVDEASGTATIRPSSKRAEVIALLEKHHMDRVEMGELCSRFADGDRGLLQKLVANSPHLEVRGQACYALAEGMKQDIGTSDFVKKAEPKDLEDARSWLGAERLAALQTLDVEQTQKEMEQIYERVVKEFGDVKVDAGTKQETTLGKRAGAALHEMRDLVVGKTTPEIEGVDLDSVAFKLSDYRGKVVLLDFWGNW